MHAVNFEMIADVSMNVSHILLDIAWILWACALVVALFAMMCAVYDKFIPFCFTHCFSSL